MSKRIAAALSLIALVFGGGYVVYRTFLSPTTDLPTTGDAEAPVSNQQKPAASPEVVLTATSVEGVVERKRPDGSWEPIASGQRLAITDTVRTDATSSARFTAGEDTVFELPASGEFSFVEISPQLSRVRLEDGRLEAQAKGRIELEFAESDAVAKTENGAFSAVTTGAGDVTVATKKGQVALASRGNSVVVPEGKQSTVRRDRPPSAPVAIPTSLFLKVRRPGMLAKKTTVIRGTATPGTVISVNGTKKLVDDSGVFETEVALEEGKNDVKLAVQDATGRTKAQLVPIMVDTRGPKSKADVEW